VTHDQEEAFTLADRVAVLEGEIRQEGAMRRVWSRPGRYSGVHAGSLAF
jgi:thiamine transport system ATP-binding protein